MASSLYGGQGASPSGQTGMNTSTGFYKEKIPKGYGKFKVEQFSPEQMDLYKNSFGNVGQDSYLSKLAGGDQEMFDQIEAPALRQFNQLQGNTASRFSGMGSGARRSSGFQNEMGQQSSNFAQQLQAQRQGLQQNALRDLHTMSMELLNQRPYETGLYEKPQGTDWGQVIGSFGGMIPGMASAAFGKGSFGGAINGGAQVAKAIPGFGRV